VKRYIVAKEPAMTDNVEDLILEQLRYIRARVDRVADDLADVKARLSAVESGLVAVRRELVGLELSDN
jgi:hypothetical protein